MIPCLSQKITSLTPNLRRNLPIEIPAAPAPLTTQVISLIFLLTIFNALIVAAPTTIAVPC